jgi:hypothetical protein
MGMFCILQKCTLHEMAHVVVRNLINLGPHCRIEWLLPPPSCHHHHHHPESGGGI